MDVEFSVEVRKKTKLSGPRVETANYIISVGAQPEFVSSLNRALQMATTDMVDWLVTGYGLEPWAAHMLVSFQAKYDVVTVAGDDGAEDSEGGASEVVIVSRAAASPWNAPLYDT